MFTLCWFGVLDSQENPGRGPGLRQKVLKYRSRSRRHFCF